MVDSEDEVPQPDQREEERSVWEELETLRTSVGFMKKAMGQQSRENLAIREALQAVAKSQEASEERLVEFFKDLEEEETPKLKRGKKVSKKVEQVEDDEEEGFSTTTKMFLSGVAGFAAGAAVTTMYFKYGQGQVPATGSATAGLPAMAEFPSRSSRVM